MTLLIAATSAAGDDGLEASPAPGSRLADLRADLARIVEHGVPDDAYPWNGLWVWAETTLSLEGQEALVALLLEPHGDLVDGLSGCMDADEVAAFARLTYGPQHLLRRGEALVRVARRRPLQDGTLGLRQAREVELAFAVGTRSIILSCSNAMTYTSSE